MNRSLMHYSKGKRGGAFSIYRGSRRPLYGAGYYSAPSYMSGGAYVFHGSRRLRGGGFLGSLRSYLPQIGRQAMQGLRTISRNKTVRNIAKEAAKRGTEVLAGVAVDALQGRNIGESFKQRSRDMALKTITGQESAPVAAPVVVNNPSKRKRGKKRKKSTPKNYPPAKKFKQGKKKGAKKRKSSSSLSRASLNRKALF